MRARLTAIVSMAAAAVCVAGVTPAAASTPRAVSPFDQRLLQDINQARAQAGLRPLRLSPKLSQLAGSWSVTMRQRGALSHNPSLATDLARHGAPRWGYAAENVGTLQRTRSAQASADRLFANYMTSPVHRRNILDPRARVVGIRTVTSPSGVAYDTCVFVDRTG
jgi:uncharacterized protein YkwD